MPEVTVGSLALRVTDAGDDANRVEAITLRALDLLGARLGELDAPSGMPTGATDKPPLIDLERQTDDEAAAIVASAWLDALALRLEG